MPLPQSLRLRTGGRHLPQPMDECRSRSYFLEIKPQSVGAQPRPTAHRRRNAREFFVSNEVRSSQVKRGIPPSAKGDGSTEMSGESRGRRYLTCRRSRPHEPRAPAVSVAHAICTRAHSVPRRRAIFVPRNSIHREGIYGQALRLATAASTQLRLASTPDSECGEPSDH